MATRPDIPLFQIETARDCAWRAFYISVRSSHDGTRANEFRRQIFHLGIDPTSSRASVFGAIAPTLRCRRSFRLYLPFMGWRANQCRLRTWWQRRVHRLDGRFS